MNTNNDTLNVLFASNDVFAPYLGISVYSLLKNNIQDFQKINLFVFDDNISDLNKSKILEISDLFNTKITFIKSKDIEKLIGEKTYLMDKDGVKSMTAYSRLFSSSVLNNIDKILYLDCDSLILQSFKELWEIDIEDYYCAGVIDSLGIDYVKKQIELEEKYNYINSGFLLINLKKWREENIEEKFLNFLKEHNNTFIFHDQGILNGVLKEKIMYLHPKFNLLGQFHNVPYIKAVKRAGYPNYYSKKIVEDAQKNPIFLHFCGGSIARPWNNKIHPYQKIYEEYYSETPFKEEIESNNSITKKEYFIYSLYQSNLLTVLIRFIPDSICIKLANKRVKKLCENEIKNS